MNYCRTPGCPNESNPNDPRNSLGLCAECQKDYTVTHHGTIQTSDGKTLTVTGFQKAEGN